MADKLFIQIDDEVREMTSDEKKEYLERIALVESDAKAKEEARSSALAKLAKLGLTEEEIASL
jgi:hypothetical protein